MVVSAVAAFLREPHCDLTTDNRPKSLKVSTVAVFLRAYRGGGSVVDRCLATASAAIEAESDPLELQQGSLRN